MQHRDIKKSPHPEIIGREDMSFIWWRHRDLNSGHCGYEPHALAN